MVSLFLLRYFCFPGEAGLSFLVLIKQVCLGNSSSNCNQLSSPVSLNFGDLLESICLLATIDRGGFARYQTCFFSKTYTLMELWSTVLISFTSGFARFSLVSSMHPLLELCNWFVQVWHWIRQIWTDFCWIWIRLGLSHKHTKNYRCFGFLMQMNGWTRFTFLGLGLDWIQTDLNQGPIWITEYGPKWDLWPYFASRSAGTCPISFTLGKALCKQTAYLLTL